jgi:Protein of unknown function (DUF3352)
MTRANPGRKLKMSDESSQTPPSMPGPYVSGGSEAIHDGRTMSMPHVTAPNPWQGQSGQPSPTIDLGATAQLGYGFEGAPGPYAKPARRKRRTAIVAGVSAVLVAAAGVGAYAGFSAWTGSGIKEPENAFPASTAAFIRVDLKPGYRDQIAFDNLAKKFPSSGKSTSDLVTDMERSMLKGSDLNYDADVKPWFGQRAGVGVYMGQKNQMVMLIALASADDEKAKQTLAKEQAGKNDFGYVVRDGYALLALGNSSLDLQGAAEAASQEAASDSLAGDSKFKSTVEGLAGHNLVIGYADLAKLGPILKSNGLAGSPASMPGMLGGIAGLGGTAALGGGAASLDRLTGTMAIGAAVAGDGIEIRGHSEGMPTAARSSSVNTLDTMAEMPDSAIVAAALQGLDKNSNTVKQLKSMLASGMGLAGGSSGEPMPAGAAEMMGNLVTDVLTSRVLSFEFSGITAGKPNLVITSVANDQNSATELMSSLGMLEGAVPGLDIKQDGATVRATVGTTPSGGKLGDSPLYREAMNGVNTSSMSLYIDVQKLLAVVAPSTPSSADSRVLQNLAPVKAIGVSGSQNGSSSDELIRIIIKK